MFSFTIPQPLNDLLDHNTLYQCCYINHYFHTECQPELQKRKHKIVSSLLSYFHLSNRNGFSINDIYFHEYHEYVRILFYHLPELFEFITQHKIRWLDLSFTCSYGKILNHPYEMISSDQSFVLSTFKQLIDLIKHNHTLHLVNVGIYHQLINRHHIVYELKNHPTLQLVETEPRRMSLCGITTLHLGYNEKEFLSCQN